MWGKADEYPRKCTTLDLLARSLAHSLARSLARSLSRSELRLPVNASRCSRLVDLGSCWIWTKVSALTLLVRHALMHSAVVWWYGAAAFSFKYTLQFNNGGVRNLWSSHRQAQRSRHTAMQTCASTGFICTLLHAADGGVLATLANQPQSFVCRNIGLIASRRFAKSIALQCHNRVGIVFQPVAQAFEWVTIDVR